MKPNYSNNPPPPEGVQGLSDNSFLPPPPSGKKGISNDDFMKMYASSSVNQHSAALSSSMAAQDKSASDIGNVKPTFKAQDTIPGNAVASSTLSAAAKAVGNIPSSLWNLAKGIGSAVLHPLNTVKGIFQVLDGAEQAISGNQSPDAFDTESRATFDALKNAMTQRYGSLDAARKTATEDPMGFGADVMSILDGGAAALGKTADLGNIVSKIGGPVQDAASAAAKASGASNLLKQAGSIEIAPYKNKYDAAADKTFSDAGIKPPLSAISKSPMVQGSEAILGKGMFGGKITETVKNATADLDQRTSGLLSKLSSGKVSDESIGRTIKQGIEDVNSSSKKYVQDIVSSAYPEGKMSSESLGKLGQDDFKKSMQTFEDEQNKVYTDFKAKYGDTTTVPGNTRNMLAEILNKQGKDLYAGINPKLKTFFEKISGETDEVKDLRKQNMHEEVIDKARMETTLPFSELQIIKESVGHDMIKFDDPNLKRIYGAISQDLNEAVESQDAGAGARLNDMNAKFHSGKQALESNLSSSVMQSSPENIPANILGKNSADTVQSFKNRVSPDTFKKYSDQFIRDIFDTSSQDGELDISKLKKTLSEYDPETVKAWLGDRHDDFQKTISALDSIDTVRNSAEVKMRQGVLSSLVKKDPADIADAIFNKNNASTIRTVKDTIGPDKFLEVQKHFMQNLFEDAVKENKAGRLDISGTLNKVTQKLKSYDQETLNEMLDPKQMKDLNDSLDQLEKFKTMDQSLKSGKKMAEGSQTEFLRNVTSTGAKLTSFGLAVITGNLPLLTKLSVEAGGEAILAKLFNSDIGRKFLTTGITVDSLKGLRGLNLSDHQVLLLTQIARDIPTDQQP